MQNDRKQWYVSLRGSMFGLQDYELRTAISHYVKSRSLRTSVLGLLFFLVDRKTDCGGVSQLIHSL